MVYPWQRKPARERAPLVSEDSFVMCSADVCYWTSSAEQTESSDAKFKIYMCKHARAYTPRTVVFEFFFLAVLGFELRASRLLDRCPTT
jgi:hypothetical protein